ncbi:uncharacterized protein TRAVEDRAFT_24263 [Trametes versicolor FP-101664 SS1]|uniref:uncharacterized protein n=1 Tax=Trametes versicolor (strain FP-101664) TaxID=717944 RepID=UPI00046249FD|nr:uncharacterized protein TRAVEDRAFT_24263 [Trametes versicolor FP-101664 SS1]EIW52879.1 hypothetical protein TRAVEDRAFT_24263 [Trametes versicolor FP-101664 SS1]
MQHHSSRSQVCHSGGRDVTVEHMPAVVVEEKQHDEYSTRIVRDRLGGPVLQARRPLEEHDGSAVIEVGVGTLRLTTTEQLRPLHQLTGETFVRAWFQCVQAHHLNWLNGIHHKDLNLNNLIYRLEDGAVCGVLSVPTGALRFMAIYLLDKKGFRGGTLLWIFPWVVCRYEDGREVDPLPRTYREWTSDHMLVCKMRKHDSKLLMRGFEPGRGPTATWTAEAELVRSIHHYLRATQLARDNKNWGMAEETREEETDEPVVWGSSTRRYGRLAQRTPRRVTVSH